MCCDQKNLALLLMKKGLVIISVASLLAFVAACKKKVAAPEANFSISSAQVKEGETFTLNNTSKNSSGISWSGTYKGFSSTDNAPSLFIDSAGDYSFTLTAKNSEGATSSKTLSLKVVPDTLYRLYGKTQKTWIVESLVYNGTETLSADCQKDDEFVIYHTGQDTFQLTEGVKKCPSGTYLFEIPASGSWTYRAAKKSLSFSLVALGNPYALDFTLSTITPTRIIGTDAVNNVTIKLWKK